jgi:transposase-like protein
VRGENSESGYKMGSGSSVFQQAGPEKIAAIFSKRHEGLSKEQSETRLLAWSESLTLFAFVVLNPGKKKGTNILDEPTYLAHTKYMEAHLTLHEAVTYFSEFENCLNFMVKLRWPDGIVKCPRCESDHVIYMANQRKWKCYEKHASPTFTLKTGTVFEDSPIALDKWIVAVWQVVNCKNGISSWELHRELGVTQKTAWFMLHRIRLAMQDDMSGRKLCGTIEVDETFIGGKARNMHKNSRKSKFQAMQGGSGKAVVIGALERKGHVRATVSSDRKKKTIQPFVREHVEGESEIHSDEHAATWQMADEYTHQIVNHLETYVAGNVHTNGIENFWSLLKRGLGGTYVSVEPFHLFRYVDEQAFRYNTRKDDAGEVITDYHRFMMALARSSESG